MPPTDWRRAFAAAIAGDPKPFQMGQQREAERVNRLCRHVAFGLKPGFPPFALWCFIQTAVGCERPWVAWRTKPLGVR